MMKKYLPLPLPLPLPLLLLLLLLLFLLGACTNSTEKSTQAYAWKNVTTVGGGFVPGIVFHPTARGVRYCRTDMGGAYRWDAKQERWKPLLDWLSYDESNLMGVESIALDPNDPDRVYLACGTYTNQYAPDGAILWSDDQGATFHRTDVPFKMGGNENGRGNGERMMVDPNNSNILYLGTRHDGLWTSTDKGKSWSAVTSFPDIKEDPPPVEEGGNRWQVMQKMGSGIVFVVFDPASAMDGKSQTIYAGVSLMNRENFFISHDGGQTWAPVSGHPTDFRLTHGILASNGVFYLTYGDNPGPWPMRNGACWKYDTRSGAWSEITPDRPEPEQNRGFGYAAVAVDAKDPDVVLVTTYHRYSAGGDEIYRSLDGGQSWTPVFASGTDFDYTAAPYIHHTGVHWMFDIEIDPNNSDHAMFTTGYGGHETFNLSAVDRGEKVTWQIMSTGIEETVPLELLSPPDNRTDGKSSGQVITAIGDYCGFVHYDLDTPVQGGCFDHPHFGNTNGIACAWQRAELIVRVGIEAANPPDENIGYSLDGGATWQPTSSMPDQRSGYGHIAVSADGNAWIWTPQRSPVYVTHDMGASWISSAGIPENLRVVADKSDPNRFYALDIFAGKLYISDDAGLSFLELPLDLSGGIPERGSDRGDSRGGQDRIYTTPGRTGDLWIAAFDGLYHSSDTGITFHQRKGVDEIHGFGFGKAAPGNEDPALYLIGIVEGIRGIYRSDDQGFSWLRINDDAHEWGLLLHITGDPKKYGRVYIGTHGRGTIYGDPVRTQKGANPVND